MRYLKAIFFFVLISLLMMGSGTKEIRITEGIQPGNFAPEINRQDLHLKSDKFTLLQFWAAYDAYSRMLNAQMHNVISHLESEDIRLISVSFDENKAVFEGIIKTEHLIPATQLNESEGEKSEIFKTYRLESGFTNLLINPEGIIVAKNVKPKEIFGYIEQSKGK